ncbi:biotin--[acetyl-CoA-carboxylase] ligase [Pirellulaceae bacterium SH501]
MDAISSVRRASALADIEAMGWFQSIRWLPESESTNKQLAEEVRSGAISLPALLVADQQTGGLGRGGNRWFSPAGCLMFSMALPFEPRESSLLSLEVGVVVAKTIGGWCEKSTQVKWPNDVYVDGRKICGILIDVMKNSTVAIVGVGINCMVSFDSAPESVQQSATSLHSCVSDCYQSDTTPETVLTHFLSNWKRWELGRVERRDSLMREWHHWSLLDQKWVVAENAVTTANQSRVEGLCLGIDSSGALRIAQPNGQVVSVIAGTISSFHRA